MIPKARLGKRSPLGALVTSTCPGTNLETGETVVTMAAAGQQATSRADGHLGLKMYFQCGGAGESSVDSSPSSCSRSVSSSIDVPKSQRSPHEVDMNELMAAMVLSSLSCSPLLHSPAQPDLTGTRGGEHERCSRSEEDFYYTEINQWEHPQQRPPPHSGHSGSSPASPASSPSSPSSPPTPSPPSPSSPSCAALSCSAPSSSGSFWQVQSEHSYQAPPPSQHVVSAAAATPSCRWTAPPTTCHKQVNLQTTGGKLHDTVASDWPAAVSCWLELTLLSPCFFRRIRGEAKKCRKVYGIEHRDQWCTACRWKKACQRFLD
ncbi:zinc finger protein 395-like [Neolamprologus brichardi]|uniref:zinc finger protein 395-like n=1 Tax=Neolamprologus brichardi TaxID=32507 RepID=UPI001643C7CD|nr:zinc finger protein 395-like [Neolamprologus brichardi]